MIKRNLKPPTSVWKEEQHFLPDALQSEDCYGNCNGFSYEHNFRTIF